MTAASAARTTLESRRRRGNRAHDARITLEDREPSHCAHNTRITLEEREPRA